ncbi:hypothetical protein D5R81_11590 [Parashewanella spongiae]|uniref:Uncharacterized protein n=2 Tax=Parashewanella spongiae TaxID=342950 RepID=A0A3A6TL27_9GAMM|nr:hypothetical protein [Parashewanella spongiae]RJY13212.1 hypothetical protein D5R81_11590 [Parashewanella spongiae]
MAHSHLKNISEIFAYISGAGLVQQLDKAQASLRLSLFVRWLIAIVALAISIMAFLSFFLAEPKYQITTGIITLIAIVVVLILSESFNNLSIGKILTLSNEVKKKDTEKETVKTENKELRQELFKIVSNIQQSQVNNTYNAPSDEWLKALGVVKSEDSPEDEQDEQEDQDEIKRAVQHLAERERSREKSRERSQNRRKAEQVALNKYFTQSSIPQSELIQRVEFSGSFDEIDPIMNRRVVFDGYLKSVTNERFIEVIPNTNASFMYYDRLYVMLNKIHFYREAKKINADLLLIIVDIEELDEESKRPDRSERVFDFFQPAISNKLLKVEHLKVSQKEIEEFEDNGQQRLL